MDLRFKRSRSIRATTISLAIAGLFMSPAMHFSANAQSSEGSIYGRAAAGAQVVVKELSTGLARTISTNADGSFSLTRLPPGRYSLTSGGVTREVDVAIGSGTQIDLAAASLDRVEILGPGRSRIDVGTTETNAVYTQAQIQALPVARSLEAVALLTPGVVSGDPQLGKGGLPSFAGASVAENGYYINGFDVTNIRNFLSYSNLPFDAIAQQQVKSGGYSAEYGRSLGGVLSIVTKRGTNEWRGGASVYWEPAALREKGRNVLDREPDRAGNYYVFKGADTKENLSTSFHLGGPIIKDKLFAFGLVEQPYNTSDTYSQNTSLRSTDQTPNGLLKIDFAPHEDHLLEFTSIRNRRVTQLTDWTSSRPYSTSHDGNGVMSRETEGGTVSIFKYTGYLTDNLTVSAMAGKVDYLRPTITGGRLSNLDCPVVLAIDLTEIGCWQKPFPGPKIKDPLNPNDTDKRDSFRFDVEYKLGAHALRAGIDNQKFQSFASGTQYYAGAYYRYYSRPANGVVNGVALPADATGYVRERVYNTVSGSFEVNNKASYIEDSWKVTKNVLLYAGLRSESFQNLNAEGAEFVAANNLLAPRLGASWDVEGNSSLKVYSNWGRYYIPVASNTNIRASGAEYYATKYFTYTGQDPRTLGPLGLTQLGQTQITSDGRAPDSGKVADTQLQPMSQDEFIFGLQKAVSKDFVFGTRAIYRKVNNGMDDYCDHSATGGIARWAADNGYTNFRATSLATCVLLNPGTSFSPKLDLNNDGKLTTVTIPASYLGLAKYERTYRGLEFTAEKPFDGKWYGLASYTVSQSRGTAEGYVQSTLNQEDAGLTQDFDFGSFTHGSKGYLPNDRRHVLKFFGNYMLSPEWRVGANVLVASGTPKSCIGFVPPSVADYGGAGAYTTASSYYCLNDQGTTVLGNRGDSGRTPWTGKLDLQVAYLTKVPTGKMTLQMDVFNVFNSRQAIETNEVRDYSRATTGVGSGNQLSQNYGLPTGFQAPRYVRFAARYEF